jgi:hypothetical protein
MKRQDIKSARIDQPILIPEAKPRGNITMDNKRRPTLTPSV